MKKKTSLTALTIAILSSAMSSLQRDNKMDQTFDVGKSDSNTSSFKSASKKPMPVLKLNLNSIEDSKFVASHTSHSSHRSHGSHGSHRSHRSFIG